MAKKGMFIGPSHANGGIPSKIAETNTPIEIEGGEYYICREAFYSPKVFSYQNKTNKQILDDIYTQFSCKLVQEVMKTNDFIVCKVTVDDPTTHTRKGTVEQILNQMQSENGCRLSNNTQTPNTKHQLGGPITASEKEAIYTEWTRLVNMTATELRNFLNTEEGQAAGLSIAEAKKLGIKSGQESAQWILKMKATPERQWTKTMWQWAQRQIRFIKRMGGNQGELFDAKGNKTRKHTSLLLWGHNPEKNTNHQTPNTNFHNGGPIMNKILKNEPTPVLHEMPDMENPVYKVDINGVEKYIQKKEGTSGESAAWYEVVKDEFWKVVGSHDVEYFNKIGETKEHAVDYLVRKYAYPIQMALGGPASSTLSELDKAQSDLNRAQELQKTMKTANSIIRSKINVTERLISEAGISEQQALKIQQPDFAGRVGFPTYALTNNNANIKRLQDRVNMLTKKVEGAKAVEKGGSEERYSFEGGEIFVNYPEDRVQILFPNGRVEKELYRKLRGNGWVYSPTNKAFQRKITPQAISNAVYMFKAVKVNSEESVAAEHKELSVSDYSKMLESRNFSYVTISLYRSIPQEYTGAKHFALVFFDDLSSGSIRNKVEAYFKENLPEIDAQNLKIDVYPKTYVREAKDLFANGKFLPNTMPASQVLKPIYQQIKGFFQEKALEVKIVSEKISNPTQSISEMMDALDPLDLWVEFPDGRYYRKFQFKKGDNIRDIADLGVKESMEDRKDGGYNVIISVRTELEADKISDLYVELYPIEGMIITKEETINPNTDAEFDEAIIEQLDPNHGWIGNQIKERVVKSQIANLITGSNEDKAPEVERIFKKFKAMETGTERGDGKNEPTLGKVSRGVILEYADQVDEILTELENQGEISASDAQKVLQDNDEFAREKYGLGLSPQQIAKKIIEKAFPLNFPDLPHNHPLNILDKTSNQYKEALNEYNKPKETNTPNTGSAFKGIHHDYKNQYELNKAIEDLLESKDSEYSSDEKNFIRKYSGYGGLDKYGPTGKGGLFEYYTPRSVIEKMWALAYKYGYNNGSIIEPSVATGEFLQFAKPGTRIVGYEISKYSAQICRILYPTAEIILQPFEQVFIKNNWTMKDNLSTLEKFDLALGNPPYGDFSIVASRYMTGMGEKDHTKAKNYVEYFIRRTVDLLKSNGLLIFIVGAQLKNGGTLFLDSGNSPVKEYLFEQCDFLDAYRLPDSVFERTGVTSEIIVLRKK